MGNYLWLPDPDLNQVDMVKDFETGGLGKMASIKVNGDKEFRYSQRLTIRMGCLFDLKDFPHDSQNCTFKLTSYTYDNAFVKFILAPGMDISKVPPAPSEYEVSVVGLPEKEQTVVW